VSRQREQGRHQRSDSGRRRLVTVLLAFVAAGGVATLLVVSVGRDQDLVRDGTSAAPAVDRAAVEAATRACQVAVARARDAVAAARPSFSHWSGHVRAQRDYDAGTATIEQTRERWATTRATADADLADFAAAYSAYEAVQDGCAESPGQDSRRQAPPGQSPPGQASDEGQDPALAMCRTEFVAVSAAAAAAKAVVDDWAAHVAMMKGKEHYGAEEYGQMWRDMVAAAPADLEAFTRASLAMSDYVDCPRPA
jgi:hypothetical protein